MNKEIMQDIISKVDGGVIVINHIIITYDEVKLSDLSIQLNDYSIYIRYDAIDIVSYTNEYGQYITWMKK